MSLSSYPAYKPSGVDWIGVIPIHWDVSPFKRQIERNDGGVWGEDPDGEADTIVLRSTEQTVDGNWRIEVPAARKLSESEKVSARLSEGDLLVTKSSGSSLHIGKTSIVSKEIADLGCCYSNFMQRVRTKKGFVPKLAWYLMNNDIIRVQFDLLSNSTIGLANLNGTMIGQAFVAVPPPDEQTLIVSFLDHETAKIDALIEEQKRLIELLNEKRQAVISQAVTRGLEPNVVMKDSELSWLGKVPAHWDVSRLSYLVRPGFSITYGIVQAGPHVEDGIPYIKTSDMSGSSLPLDGYARTSHEIAASYERSKVAAGDLVIAIRASIGKCLPVPVELNGANLTQGTAKIAPGDMIDSGYLLAYINSLPVQNYLNALSKGATFKEITLDVLRKTPVVLPPLDEQRQIADHAYHLDRQFQLLIKSAEAAEVLLRERRAALIAAAVTGKIDVRGLAHHCEGVAV